MKSVFIACDQAHHDDVLTTLTHFNCRGYTAFGQVTGRGTRTGDPHLGSHAWPAMNEAILTIVDDAVVPRLLEALHDLDTHSDQLGLRAFVWNVEATV